MVSAGERSHHGGGPISPRPTGSGSRSLRRCSMAAQRAAGARQGRGPRMASVSAKQLGARREQVVLVLARQLSSPFPGPARPATLTQTPATTGGSHWPKPRTS